MIQKSTSSIYTLKEFNNCENLTYDAKGDILDGKNTVSHILKIHNCANLIIKNLTLTRGNTTNTKYLKRSEINFSNRMRSVFEILDGGAVLITGKSNVEFINCRFINNNSIMCGGAVSNQSTGLVTFTNCTFENNKAGHTGAAIDNLTSGANITVKQCKFLNNVSNVWHKVGSPHGQISAFPNTIITITNCTFHGGSIPIDYCINTKVTMRDNIWEGYGDWIETSKHREVPKIKDYIKLSAILHWVIPKTLGKVYYGINLPQSKIIG